MFLCLLACTSLGKRRHELARRLSRNGGFTVLFVSYPQHPDVFEFVDREKRVRYINVDSSPGARVSQLI